MGVFYSTKLSAISPQLSYKNVVKNNHSLSVQIDRFNYQKSLQKSDSEIAGLLNIQSQKLQVLKILSQLRNRSEPDSKETVNRKDSERIRILVSAGIDLKFISQVTGYNPDLILTNFRKSFLDYQSNIQVMDEEHLNSHDWQAVECQLFLLKKPQAIAQQTGIETWLVKIMIKDILDHYQSSRKSNQTLTLDDKIVLELLHERGCSNCEISRRLNCSASTIANELSRISGTYSAYESQKQQKKRYHQKRGYSKLNKAQDYITALNFEIREQNYSPESFYYFNRTNPEAPFYDLETVSAPTYYNYVQKGVVSLKPEELPKGLKTQKETPEFDNKPNKKSLGRSIDEMPEIEYDGARVKPFNWEIDTLLGSKKKDKAILTLRERRTNFSMGFLIENKDSQCVNNVMQNIIHRTGFLACDIFRTIVSDNGSEFALLDSLKEGVGENVYFAHPSTPTDKPNVERFNQQLREFFPKGKSMANLTQFKVQNVVDKINNRPSKVLNWASPKELFLIELRKLLDSKRGKFTGNFCSSTTS